MAAYHSDEILDGAALPLRYAAFSPCFRKEAGSHGKDTQGIIRVHWFDKVEMFVYTTRRGVVRRAPAAARRGRRSSSTSSSWPTGSSTPRPATSGSRRTRKFDCEAWIPTQGKYRELTSTSNCTDFQARRLDIRGRVRRTDGKPVATLNGTLCAIDPHDRRDPRDPPAGRRLGPGARRRCSPYLGGREVLEPVGGEVRAAPAEPGWRRGWSRSTSTAPC